MSSDAPALLSPVTGKSLKLSKIATDETGGLTKEKALAKLEKLTQELCELQELQFAAGESPVLIVLQGRDTSGKDGTIRQLLLSLNAQSTRVAGFKVPTPLEMSHDFLWRVHSQVPGKGETVIFNRSHYEDVLVVRVHDLVEKKVWKRRFDQINEFEELLAESGTIMVKFFLHISKEEQEERLLEREEDPTKSWKLNIGDWKERELWDDYTDAYEDALSKCSTKVAPWYVVPADHKWFRNLAIVETLVLALRPEKKRWMTKLETLGIKMKAELSEFRLQKAASEKV